MRQGALRFSSRNPMWVSAAPTRRRIEKCGALGAILGFIVTCRAESVPRGLGHLVDLVANRLNPL